MTAYYDIDKEVSSLCATGLKPQILTGILLRLLTRHFSTPKGIQEPQLKSYIWNPDPAASKILIVPVWQWNTRAVQKRPALVLKRNSLEPRTLGLGDGQAVIPALSDVNVPADAPAGCQVAMSGSHTIFALSEQPVEAELLSTEVFMRLMQYQQAIQDEFGFNRFRVAEVGPVARLEESSETFAVPVSVGYAYVESWQIVTAAPYLKRVVLETNI